MFLERMGVHANSTHYVSRSTTQNTKLNLSLYDQLKETALATGCGEAYVSVCYSIPGFDALTTLGKHVHQRNRKRFITTDVFPHYWSVVYRGNPRGQPLKAVAHATRITVDNRRKWPRLTTAYHG